MSPSKNPPLSLQNITQKVFSFLREKDVRTSSQSLQRKARAIVCRTFGLSDIQWACSLSHTSYDITPLNWLWDLAIDEHTPLSRILHEKFFWKYHFQISSHTLDPRWETEGLIMRALHYAPHARRVLDLGTGSGCLLISLLKEYTDAQGVGVDLCPHALSIAQKNASALNVQHLCQWVQSSWFDTVPTQSKFDVIVTNPPIFQQMNPCPQSSPDGILALLCSQDMMDWMGIVLFSPIFVDFWPPRVFLLRKSDMIKDLLYSALQHNQVYKNMRIQKDDAQRDRYATYLDQ